jgi:hypothetical protein
MGWANDVGILLLSPLTISVIAQLHPSDRETPFPQGVDHGTQLEGPGDAVELGPKGMYCSVGFEDLEGLMPWVELRGGGGNSSEAMRGGMGFEP